MAPKSLHDDHTARLAWRMRRSRHVCLCDGQVRYRRTAHPIAEPSIAKSNLEKWMKLVTTSAIAFAISALLAGPVLAQGAASDTQTRGGAQGRTNNMQGGASGSGDEEFDAQQPGAPGTKAGVNAKAGAKGTVGAGRGATKGSAGTVGDPAASGGKRY
jgi:hypothetical protein